MAAVTGAEQLSASLARFKTELGDLGRAHRAAALIIAAAASRSAPRRTGALAASIRPEALRSGAAVVVDARYGGVVHAGWPAGGIPARPFLTRAVASSAAAWVGCYEAEVAAAAAKVWGI